MRALGGPAALLVVAVALGCGSSPPPRPPPAPTTRKVPPLEAEVGGRHLVVRFAGASLHGDAHAAERITSIELDGATLYPRDCAAKGKTKLLACSHGHRAVTKANDFHLVGKRTSDKLVELLIAGRSSNSLECGAHDYWVLRVDKSGASASEPAVGCFTMPSLDADALNPVIDWGPPLSVRTFDEQSNSCALKLPPGATTWTITRSKKP